MICKHPIHFVGSIGLEDAETVFRTLSNTVGDKAFFYPDGETGVRHYWVVWQGAVFENHPDFETAPPSPPRADGTATPPKFRLTGDAATLKFDPVGYAEEAIRSYGLFASLKKDGTIPASVRFQVSLPTPTAVVESFVAPDDCAAVQPAYVRAMAAEVDQIHGTIPHDDLALQWDTALEVIAYDGGPPIHLSDVLGDTVTLIDELSRPIPPQVKLGIHLCYGDPGHKHIVEPKDLATSVKFANALSAGVSRRLDFIHMAVPRERNDEAYFAPLKDLAIGPARLVLGLIHYTDGLDGTKQRLSVAEKHASEFSIATECGFGRRDPATIPDLLRIHAQAAG